MVLICGGKGGSVFWGWHWDDLQQYSGVNEKDSRRFMFEYLVQLVELLGGLGGAVLLRGCHRGWSLRCQKKSTISSVLSPSSCLRTICELWAVSAAMFLFYHRGLQVSETVACPIKCLLLWVALVNVWSLRQAGTAGRCIKHTWNISEGTFPHLSP